MLEPRSAAWRALSTAVYLAAVVLFVLLQEVGIRLRREEHRAWWAGNGRDVINAAGFAALAGVLRLLGFPSPAALLLGGTLTLVLFGAYVFMATQTEAAHPRAWAIVIGVAVSLPVLALPAAVAAALAAIVHGLFHGVS